MHDNPLKSYFRQPVIYLRLPSGGIWYDRSQVILNDDIEVGILPMTAHDEVMINTPDAVLNGTALSKVIGNCVENVFDPSCLVIPDLEALFVAIRIATDGPKYDMDHTCPKCSNESTFEVDLQMMLDTMSYVELSDTKVDIDGLLTVNVQPYNLRMRHLYTKKEIEEQRIVASITNDSLDTLSRAQGISESIDRISTLTFELVGQSITKILIKSTNVEVIDKIHITEWLNSIGRNQADTIIDVVKKLNSIGINKKISLHCDSCGNEWTDILNLDPTSFFGKR